MKKLLFLIIIFLLLSSVLHSLEIDKGLSLGVIGVGFNVNPDNERNVYVYGRLLNIFGEFKNGFGFTFSPFVFSLNFYNTYSENNFSDFNKSLLYFINTSIYYNFLKPEFLCIEVGYTYENKNNHYFYGIISLDLIAALFLYFSSIS